MLLFRGGDYHILNAGLEAEHPVLLTVKTNQNQYWISLPVVCTFSCQGVLGGFQVFSAQGKAGFLMKPLRFLLLRIKRHRSVTVVKCARPACPTCGPGNSYRQSERQMYGNLRQPRTLPLRSLRSWWWGRWKEKIYFAENLGLGEMGFLLENVLKYALLSRFRIISKFAWK